MPIEPFVAPTEPLITIRVSGQARPVGRNTPLLDVLPRTVDGLPVVAALVDRQATSLLTPITASCDVEALTTHEWEGQRVYRRSLGLLALEAAHAVAPELEVTIGPSVGFGQRINVPTLADDALDEFARLLEHALRDVVATGARLRQDLWSVAFARQHFAAMGRTDAAALLETWRDAAVPVTSYGAVYAIDFGPLLPDTARVQDFHFVVDGPFLLLVYGRRAPHERRPTLTMPAVALADVTEKRSQAPRSEPSPRLDGLLRNGHSYDVGLEELGWLRALGVTSAGTFNHACVQGDVATLIRVSEGFQEKRLALIADEIQRRSDRVDVVCIAGPSASGKTTFIRRLCVQLQVNGITPVAMGLDDYYVDREKTPKDESGDYDFEALGAISLSLLHEHVLALLSGQRVKTPRYDFVLGKSSPSGGRELRLGSRNVLLIEGIHGLNPELLGPIDPARVFRIFVCPLLQYPFDHLTRLHASDLRLVRRLVRDRHARGLNAVQTIERWPKVRAGERRHIYPYQPNADAVFDSSVLYELSVLKVYAERYLLEVPREAPAYTTAFRMMHLLDRFVSLYPDQVPANSILREFIGGSGFDT